MKKIKLLTPILGLTAISSALIPLASCSCKKEDVTGGVIPSDAFEIKDVTLHGFKDDYDYKNYTKLVIPENVKVIDTDAFNAKFTPSTKVTEVVIPGNVETIRKGAFAGNNNITTYDFSSYTIDQIYALEVEAGAFALDTNGIYSFVKMNDEWTDVQKEVLKNKLITGGIPAYCFVKQTKDNVELNSTSEKEQTANGGEAQNIFDVKGQYGSQLRYEAILTVVEASEGVDIDHNVTCETSSDYKSVYVDAKMVAKEGHTFSNEDYVTYKVTLICYTNNGTEEVPNYKAKWSETLETFKLTYHNILTSIECSGPTKTSYRVDQKFDPTGLKVTTHMSNGNHEEISWGAEGLTTNLEDYTFTLEDVMSTEGVIGYAFYTLDGITKSDTFDITMLDSLAKIEFKDGSIPLEYSVGKTIDIAKLQITPYFAVSKNPELQPGTPVAYGAEGLTVTCDLDFTKKLEEKDIGDHEVNVEYVVDGITKTCSFTISVTEAQTFAIDDDGYITLNDTSMEGAIVIPEKVGDITVKGVADNGFNNANKITSITFTQPDNITYIGSRAFLGVELLTTFEIPKNVTLIGDYAFAKTGLTSLIVPCNVKTIGARCFEGCGALESIAFPDTPKEPSSLEVIGQNAFFNCDNSNFTSITLPESLKELGVGALAGASKLTSVHFSKTENWMKEDGSRVDVSNDSTNATKLKASGEWYNVTLTTMETINLSKYDGQDQIYYTDECDLKKDTKYRFTFKLTYNTEMESFYIMNMSTYKFVDLKNGSLTNNGKMVKTYYIETPNKQIIWHGDDQQSNDKLVVIVEVTEDLTKPYICASQYAWPSIK